MKQGRLSAQRSNMMLITNTWIRTVAQSNPIQMLAMPGTRLMGHHATFAGPPPTQHMGPQDLIEGKKGVLIQVAAQLPVANH